MSDKEKVYIFDTTMRDGEQSPGASMSVEEKIQISKGKSFIITFTFELEFN